MSKPQKQNESDATFFLKILLFFIIGTVWLRFSRFSVFGIEALPIGLPLGVVFASHDHFAIDRKIEYAILLVSTIVSFFLPLGVVV